MTFQRWTAPSCDQSPSSPFLKAISQMKNKETKNHLKVLFNEIDLAESKLIQQIFSKKIGGKVFTF
jgi:hypothetical protein